MNGPQPDPDPTRTAALSSIAPTTPTNLETVAPVPAAEPAAAPAARFGEYVLLGELGRGGMGAVYRAEDPRLKREVALKVMLPQFAAHDQARARFVREARAQARVEHDHVAAILHIGDHQGLPFIVMPLLKGMTLHAALRANPRPPLAEVIRIGREVAEGLAAAHEKGLVHRDIKPANVWLEGKKLRVKILDFGLARAADTDATDATDGPVTREGAVVGTPAYMSPEQGRGLPVDGRTDLWSLGVVLYQMTTGELPFRGANTLAILTALAIDHPPPPAHRNPAVPQHLSDFVVRLLAKDPAYRPPTAEAAAEELRAIEAGLVNAVRVIPLDAPPPIVLAQDGQDPFAELDATEASTAASAHSVGAVPEATPVRAAAAKRRGGFPVWALVGGVLLAVAGVIGFVASQMGKKPEPEVAKEEPAPPQRSGPKKDSTPPAAGGADRAAIEAIHPFAHLTLLLPSREGQNFGPGDALPDGPLEVAGISAASNHAMPPDFAALSLKAIAGQKSFTGFYDAYQLTEWTEAEFARLAELPCRTTLTQFRTGLHLTPKSAETLKRFPNVTGLGLLAGAADDAVLGNLKDVSQRQQYLVVRDLGKSGRVTGAGWAAVAGQDCGEMVLVKPVGMNRAACEAIARMPKLTALTIDGGALDAGMLEALSKCPNLGSLNLTRTAVAAGAGKHFADFRSITQLLCTFCGPGLTDDDAPHFASMKTLRSLSLNGTGVTEAGGKLLSAALPRCHIDAGEKSFEPTDAHFREASRLLGRGGFEVVLKRADGGVVRAKVPGDLPEAAFTLSGVVAIGASPLGPFNDDDLKRLAATPTLDQVIAANTVVTADGLRALLASRKTLTNLYLAGTKLSDAECKVVGAFTELTNLHVGAAGSTITDAGIADLGKLTRLASLTLHGTGLTDAGLKHLTGLTRLTFLWIDLTAVSDEGIGTLAGLTSLTDLNVSGTRVTEAGYKKLRAALPKCKITWEDPNRAIPKAFLGRAGFEFTLRLPNGTTMNATKPEDLPPGPFTVTRIANGSTVPISNADLVRLSALPGVENLALGEHRLTDAGLAPLLNWKGSLQLIALRGGTVTDEGMAVVAGLPRVGVLDLVGMGVTDAGVERLAGMAAVYQLALNRTRITDAGLRHVAKLQSLDTLWLNETAVSDAGVDTLGTMKGLKALGLHGTRVTDAGFKRLKDALPNCKIEWSPPAARTLRPEDGWVRVLAVVDLARDHPQGVGTWVKTPAGFLGSHDRPDNAVRLRLPLTVAGDYELAVDLERPKGARAAPVVEFPVGDKNGAGIALDLGGKAGLGVIDGRDIDENGTATDFALADERPVSLTVRVTTAGDTATVVALVDQKPLVSWKGRTSALTVESGAFAPGAVDITFGPPGKLIVRDVRLRMLTGEARPTRPGAGAALFDRKGP
ncbi:protein kinase domain-containing protein [Gemmata sp.]|uniref:protein kinase domain-containing protein n=1 Tax=Gemmata sp. TaxID=1914242 RepID=UPI003F6EF7CE